jgi:hypothetical protein
MVDNQTSVRNAELLSLLANLDADILFLILITMFDILTSLRAEDEPALARRIRQQVRTPQRFGLKILHES